MKKIHILHLTGVVLLSAALIGNCNESSSDNSAALAVLALVGGNGSTSGSDSGGACKEGGTCMMFISASGPSGSSGISGLDSLCNSDANKPSGSTSTYKALVADGTNRRACSTANCGGGSAENIDWVLKPSTKYVKSDGSTELFTTNSSGIFQFGNLSNQMTSSATDLGTALNSDWTPTGQDCSDFASSSNTVNFSKGQATSTDGNFIDLGSFTGCGNAGAFRLICVEQ